MDTKAVWYGSIRFSSMRSQELCAWDTGIRHPMAFTLALGQWFGAWLLQHWLIEDIGSRQPANHPAKQHWQTQIRPAYLWQHTMLVISALSLQYGHSNAAFIEFQNCLPPSVINNTPLQLQFTPLYVYATFNTTAASHNLNVTVYGNVSGAALPDIPVPALLPAFNDTQYWSNPKETVGKIIDVSPIDNVASTLFASFNVLSYTPYALGPTRFANTSLQGQFPLAPVFTPNASKSELPAFSVAHELYSSYAFTSISATSRVISGDPSKSTLACVIATVTPDLGSTISNCLRYLPLVVLIMVGFATAFAGMYSLSGSTDIFRWTSNYGRDADLLRLVTPGFGDCLHYIQFIVLTGSLSLNYPGFFRPVVSQVSWSALMFNESFVSHGSGITSLVDGIYMYSGNYGLDRTSQLVGMTAEEDIWAGMVIWLLAILAAVIVIIQIGFLCRWGYRHLSHTTEEDLRAKNIPFTIGNAIRIVFNYFLLPIVALSMFQLVVAARSPASTVGFAAVLIVALIGFAAWLLWLVASTRPRSYLFDDLPTVLLYGPLYNTYSDNAATFALVPVMLTFVRGIAIGAVQPSGTAQLVLLAICEVILILTLNAFRPFSSPTSMNLYHTFFAVVRLLTILLCVAFVPSLGVTEGTKGWIGYVILLMHAIVLVFGFFLNAIQTIIEVAARLAGAGGEEGVQGGAARGGLSKVFGMRQLSRRNPRRAGRARNSLASEAAILGPDGSQKSAQLSGERSRSMSASSAVLLNRHGASSGRTSVGLESTSVVTGHHHRNSGGGPYTPSIAGEVNASSYVPGASQSGREASPRGGIVNLKSAEAADPYYRPPRARRPTVDAYSPGARSRGSWASADWANKRWSQHSPEQESSPDAGEGPSTSGRATPLPAHLGGVRDQSDLNIDDPRRSKTDYAIREVDFYYHGFRGPALSNLPTRRLKTGPADPTGPVSSATGWVKSLFGGKTKDKGKGFEVVRSSRVPQLGPRSPPQAIGLNVPYTDQSPVEVARDLDLSDEGNAVGGGTRHMPEEEAVSSEEDVDESDGEHQNRVSQISQFPPSLPVIDPVGGIELPSRIVSKASSRPSRGSTRNTRSKPPTVPRRSSRRNSSHGKIDLDDPALRLSAIAPSPPSSPKPNGRLYNPDSVARQHLHPTNSTTSRLPFGAKTNAAGTTRLSTAESTTSSTHHSLGDDDVGQAAGRNRHSSSALGSLAPDTRNDRPSSMGYVQQHRASDNIHTASPDDASFLGSTAELVDDPNRRSLSPDTKPTPR